MKLFFYTCKWRMLLALMVLVFTGVSAPVMAIPFTATGQVCTGDSSAEATNSEVIVCVTYTVTENGVDAGGNPLLRYSYLSELSLDSVPTLSRNSNLAPSLEVLSFFAQTGIDMTNTDIVGASHPFDVDRHNLGLITEFGFLMDNVGCSLVCEFFVTTNAPPVWGSFLLTGMVPSGDSFNVYNGNSGGTSNDPIGGSQPFGLLLTPGQPIPVDDTGVVPEPGTLSLAVLGLGLVAKRRRNRIL
jgi:hypothetical protein